MRTILVKDWVNTPTSGWLLSSWTPLSIYMNTGVLAWPSWLSSGLLQVLPEYTMQWEEHSYEKKSCINTLKVLCTLCWFRWQLEWDYEGHPARGVRLQWGVSQVKIYVFLIRSCCLALFWPNSNSTFLWANILLFRNCCVNQYFAPLFFVVFVLMAQFVSSPGNLHKIICISGVGQCGRCRAHETSWRKPQTGEDRVDWVLIMKLIPNQPGWRSGCMVCMFSF